MITLKYKIDEFKTNLGGRWQYQHDIYHLGTVTIIAQERFQSTHEFCDTIELNCDTINQQWFGEDFTCIYTYINSIIHMKIYNI